MKQLVTASACIMLFLLTAFPTQSHAQWGIGASYEIQQEEPKNGFGVRAERAILGQLPIVDLRLRTHFSYFSEDNYVDENEQSFGEIENYDFGLAAIGGVSVGLLMHYVGVGLGSTTINLEEGDAGNPGGEDSNIFWNALIGAEVSPIPAIKPFVEYRFEQAEEPDFAPQSEGRLVFGVSIFF
jgi:opacity protein-like surface antigen